MLPEWLRRPELGICESVSREALEKIAENQFFDMVKGVVDIEKGIMALGGELHAD